MTCIREHFSYRKLLKYTFPSVVMMVFCSIYGVIDGLFIANFVGKTAFAAVNFILPYPMVLSGVGFMFGSGGSALIAKTLGEKEEKKANQIFSLLLWVSTAVGVLLAIIGYFTVKPVAVLFGAEGVLLENALAYGKIYLLGVPLCLVQYEFQNLFATAGKPRLGLISTVVSGVANILLDALFVAGLSWGLEGAAFATVISQCIGGLFPFFYFTRKNKSALKVVAAPFDIKSLSRICTNGFSELLNNISMSLVGMIYNIQLLRYAGNDGLAAFGVLMYVDFMFISMFIGYTVGASPIVSYHYGAENHREIKSLLRKSTVILGFTSLLMFAFSELLGPTVSGLFSAGDGILYEMIKRGFLLYSFCFLFSGFAIFSSAFFTALNNGVVSAILSFLRTVVFQVLAVFLLPLVFDLDGIWLSVALAEALTAFLGYLLIFRYRKHYQYG